MIKSQIKINGSMNKKKKRNILGPTSKSLRLQTECLLMKLALRLQSRYNVFTNNTNLVFPTFCAILMPQVGIERTAHRH